MDSHDTVAMNSGGIKSVKLSELVDRFAKQSKVPDLAEQLLEAVPDL